MDFNASNVVSCITKERLTKYFQRVGLNQDDRALDLYCWNHEVGASFNSTLQQFEVCLRNSIAISLRDSFGNNWFNSVKLIGYNAAIQSIMSATVEKATENRNGFFPTEHDVIAASSLGLWRELCKPEYAGVFWGKRVKSFPNIPMKDARECLENVHNRVHRLVKLRNRIAHHEHLLGSHKEKLGEMLSSRHKDMFELINWMNLDFFIWLKQRDSLYQHILRCPIPDRTCTAPLFEGY